MVNRQLSVIQITCLILQHFIPSPPFKRQSRTLNNKNPFTYSHQAGLLQGYPKMSLTTELEHRVVLILETEMLLHF